MRRIRKRYKRPMVPYDKTHIKEEKAIMSKFGLRKKEEILIAEESLRAFRQIARKLIWKPDEEKEKTLLNKLSKLGLLKKDAELDDVLALKVNDVLKRRLQSIVFDKGFGESILHARQLIAHGHIAVDGRRIKFPSFIVPAEEEDKIEWYDTSVMKSKKPSSKKSKKKPQKEETEKESGKKEVKEEETKSKD